MTTTQTLTWNRIARDKYGRSLVSLDRIVIDNETGHWVGQLRDLAVVVTLPKRSVNALNGMRYLVNVRPTLAQRKAGQYLGTVTYFAKRNDALRHAERAVSSK